MTPPTTRYKKQWKKQGHEKILRTEAISLVLNRYELLDEREGNNHCAYNKGYQAIYLVKKDLFYPFLKIIYPKKF